MTAHDIQGQPLCGADTASAAHYQRALRELQCYIEDPVASVDMAIAERPDFVMAHVLRAYLHLLGTEPAGIPVALALRAYGERHYAEAARMIRDVRETAHRFGGSHAQRDLLDLTLIECTLRSDPPALARALSAERLERRDSPLSRLFAQKAAPERAAA
jgi:hypothetical protein